MPCIRAGFVVVICPSVRPSDCWCHRTAAVSVCWHHLRFTTVTRVQRSGSMSPRQGATQIARFARAATQNRLRRTPLLSRQNWVVFKRRRHRVVYDDTVADRPRGFGIVARTKKSLLCVACDFCRRDLSVRPPVQLLMSSYLHVCQ